MANPPLAHSGILAFSLSSRRRLAGNVLTAPPGYRTLREVRVVADLPRHEHRPLCIALARRWEALRERSSWSRL